MYLYPITVGNAQTPQNNLGEYWKYYVGGGLALLLGLIILKQTIKQTTFVKFKIPKSLNLNRKDLNTIILEELEIIKGKARKGDSTGSRVLDGLVDSVMAFTMPGKAINRFASDREVRKQIAEAGFSKEWPPHYNARHKDLLSPIHEELWKKSVDWWTDYFTAPKSTKMNMLTGTDIRLGSDNLPERSPFHIVKGEEAQKVEQYTSGLGGLGSPASMPRGRAMSRTRRPGQLG